MNASPPVQGKNEYLSAAIARRTGAVLVLTYVFELLETLIQLGEYNENQ